MSSDTLFDPAPFDVDAERYEFAPAVRLSDPVTSHAAAARCRAGSLARRVAEVLAAFPAGLTDREIAAVLGEADRLGSVVKRRQDVGAVDTGLRRPTPSGCEAIVWALLR